MMANSQNRLLPAVRASLRFFQDFDLESLPGDQVPGLAQLSAEGIAGLGLRPSCPPAAYASRHSLSLCSGSPASRLLPAGQQRHSAVLHFARPGQVSVVLWRSYFSSGTFANESAAFADTADTCRR